MKSFKRYIAEVDAKISAVQAAAEVFITLANSGDARVIRNKLDKIGDATITGRGAEVTVRIPNVSEKQARQMVTKVLGGIRLESYEIILEAEQPIRFFRVVKTARGKWVAERSGNERFFPTFKVGIFSVKGKNKGEAIEAAKKLEKKGLTGAIGRDGKPERLQTRTKGFRGITRQVAATRPLRASFSEAVEIKALVVRKTTNFTPWNVWLTEFDPKVGKIKSAFRAAGGRTRADAEKVAQRESKKLKVPVLDIESFRRLVKRRME